MISEDDAFYTYEYNKFYKIIPNFLNNKDLKKYIKKGAKVKKGFSYSSDNNKHWVTKKQLLNYIKEIEIL